MDMKAPLAHPAVWRAGQLGHGAVRALGSQHPGLDAELPGHGWPLGMLTELIGREPGIGELRLLVPVLRQLTRERRIVVLLGPPLVPYAPALAGFGIELDHLIVVDAHNPADRLWAIEQTLRSESFGALLAWLPSGAHARPEHLRRLQSAAQGAAGPVFLFRDLSAQQESSPAPLRLLLLPLPADRLSVRILKRRGPVLGHSLAIELPRPDSALPLRHRPAEAPAQLPSTVHARGATPAGPSRRDGALLN